MAATLHKKIPSYFIWNTKKILLFFFMWSFYFCSWEISFYDSITLKLLYHLLQLSSFSLQIKYCWCKCVYYWFLFINFCIAIFNHYSSFFYFEECIPQIRRASFWSLNFPQLVHSLSLSVLSYLRRVALYLMRWS